MLMRTILATIALSIYTVFFFDMTLKEFRGYPQETFLSSLLKGSVTPQHMLIPAAGLIVGVLLMGFLFTKLFLRRYAKRCRKNVDLLVNFDTPYWEHTWSRAREKVSSLLKTVRLKGIFSSHQRNLETLEKFRQQELQAYFEKTR